MKKLGVIAALLSLALLSAGFWPWWRRGITPVVGAAPFINVWVNNLTNHNVANYSQTGTNTFTLAASSSEGNMLAATASNFWHVGATTAFKRNGTTGAIMLSVSTSGTPYSECYDGSNMWIVAATGLVASAFNETTGAPVRMSAGLSGYARGCAFDGTNIWVGSDGVGLYKIVAATGATTGPFASGAGPMEGLVFDGTNLWLAGQSANSVYKFNTAGTVLATITASSSPTGVAFDGTNVWVTSSVVAGSLTVYNASTNAVVRYVTVSSTPYGLTFDGTYMWASHLVSPANVSKISLSGVVQGVYSGGSGIAAGITAIPSRLVKP